MNDYFSCTVLQKKIDNLGRGMPIYIYMQTYNNILYSFCLMVSIQ